MEKDQIGVELAFVWFVLEAYARKFGSCIRRSKIDMDPSECVLGSLPDCLCDAESMRRHYQFLSSDSDKNGEG